jgi:N6-L-threonylcarbamoyladenine synthase
LRGRELDDEIRADVAHGFQEAVVETLAEKTQRALTATGHRRLVVAGGVGANRRLRERLAGVAAAGGAELFFPRAEFCTDNGAMIALAGCLRLSADVQGAAVSRAAGLGLGARANWPLAENA